MKSILIALALVACGGGSIEEPPPSFHCEDGRLTVLRPDIELVRAAFPPATPPERLLAHTTEPAAFITSELDWNEFHLYAPSDSFVVTTIDYATGRGICPTFVEVLP